MEENFHRKAIDFIHEHVEAWAEVTTDTSSIELLTGTSNKVFRVENSCGAVPHRIIYRSFGPNEVTDKTRERKMYRELCAAGLAPFSYGESETERLEEFLEGYITMTATSFTDSCIIKSICERLRRMHSVDMTVCLENEGLIVDVNIQKWRKLVLDKLGIFENLEEFREIVELVSEETWNMYNEVVPRDSPVVYSHLDPNPLNFLYNPSTREVYFIDFEFSGYFYRSTDFGLMLTETKFNFLVDEPPFYEYYAERDISDELIKEYAMEYGGGSEMWGEIKRSVITSNYIWAVWDIAMAKVPVIGFDFIANAMLRFREFKKDYYQFKSYGGQNHLESLGKQIFSTI